MKFKFFNVLIAFFFCFKIGYNQNQNDVKVTLHEETLNKIFASLGEISGVNDYEVMLIKGKYKWTIQNPKIILKPVKSSFVCDAIVEVGGFNYKAPVVGDLSITYNAKTNQISVKLVKAIFEIYTKILGKKFHIKDIDIAEYLKDPFLFEGPQTMSTDMEFVMPDNSKRKVYMQPSSCYMIVIDKQIITSCEMAVDNKPIKQSAVVVQSSTINENKVTITNEPIKEEETKKKKRKKKKATEAEKK